MDPSQNVAAFLLRLNSEVVGVRIQKVVWDIYSAWKSSCPWQVLYRRGDIGTNNRGGLTATIRIFSSNCRDFIVFLPRLIFFIAPAVVLEPPNR